MPQRPGKWMGNRMRKRATSRCSRPGECFIRGKQNHEGAEGCDKRRIDSAGHGTHQFVGYGGTVQRTLRGAFRARKCIVNYWLRRNVNAQGGPQGSAISSVPL